MKNDTDFREIVRDEMKIQGLTTYRLAKMLAGKVAYSTLYGWMQGNYRIADDKLAAILDTLNLKIESDRY